MGQRSLPRSLPQFFLLSFPWTNPTTHAAESKTLCESRTTNASGNVTYKVRPANTTKFQLKFAEPHLGIHLRDLVAR